MFDRHALVGLAVQQQDRDRHLIGAEAGGDGVQIGRALGPVAAQRLAVEELRIVFLDAGKVRYAGIGDGAAIERAVALGGAERGIAAIGGAGDADALGIGDALLRQKGDRVVEVVLHLETPFAFARLDEGGAIAGRAAVIGLDDGIALFGEILDPPVPAFAVARDRAAVGQDDQRQVFRIRAMAGERQDRLDRRAVARGIMDGLDRRQAAPGERVVLEGVALHAVAAEIPVIERAGLRRAADLDQHLRTAGAARDDARAAIADRGVGGGLDPLQGRVEPDDMVERVGDADPQRVVAVAVLDDAVDVVAGVVVHLLAER